MDFATNTHCYIRMAGRVNQAVWDLRLLSHNLIEAVLLGALGEVKVEGEWDTDLMEQLASPRPIEER